MCHILVLSYSTLHTADAVRAWNEVRTEITPFDHLAVHHCPLTMATQIFWYCWIYLILFDTSFSFFYFWHPRQLLILPLGCSELSAKDRQATQDSNNSFLVTSWFAEQAALQRVHFLFLCPEDFGGHSQHGPASPWSLVEFQRVSGFNDIWRGAAFMCRFADMEQRHPTGMLSNIQGLRRSTYPGWRRSKT